MSRNPLFDAMKASQDTYGGVFINARMNRRKFLPRRNAVAKVNRWHIRKLEQCGNRLKVMLTMDYVRLERGLCEVGENRNAQRIYFLGHSPSTLL